MLVVTLRILWFKVLQFTAFKVQEPRAWVVGSRVLGLEFGTLNVVLLTTYKHSAIGYWQVNLNTLIRHT